MSSDRSSDELLRDFITGRKVPNMGAEANRQQVERFLVETKGYAFEDIEIDVPIRVELADGSYTSTVDLTICVHGKRYVVIKCAPGSLASREREVIAAARLLEAYQIPLAIASDGKTALVWDTVTGKSLGQGFEAVPSKSEAEKTFNPTSVVPLDETHRGRISLIFKSYDSMNVNKQR